MQLWGYRYAGSEGLRLLARGLGAPAQERERSWQGSRVCEWPIYDMVIKIRLFLRTNAAERRKEAANSTAMATATISVRERVSCKTTAVGFIHIDVGFIRTCKDTD